MKLPLKIKAYIGIVFISAIILLVLLMSRFELPNLWNVIFWVILGAITESVPIIFHNGVGISVGYGIVLASIIVGGPFLGYIVVVLSGALKVYKNNTGKYSHILNTDLYKTIFNLSQLAICGGCTGLVYLWSGGSIGNESFSFNLIPLLLAVVTFVLLNSSFMSILISMLSSQKLLHTWINNIRGLLPSALAVSILGLILALAYITYAEGAVLLFFAPLLLSRYSFKLYMEMKAIYMDTIKAFNKSLEAKDPYTSGHASRVGEFAVDLAKAVNLSPKQIENIKIAAILHDIGKIGIDDIILRKPDRLTEQEFSQIKRHPEIGADILSNVSFLKNIAIIIRHHHERYDGKGYPDGLKGEQIPVESSVLAVADTFDAMTSNRPYRSALSREFALEEIKKNAGTQFDSELALKFVEIMGKEATA